MDLRNYYTPKTGIDQIIKDKTGKLVGYHLD